MNVNCISSIFSHAVGTTYLFYMWHIYIWHSSFTNNTKLAFLATTSFLLFPLLYSLISTVKSVNNHLINMYASKMICQDKYEKTELKLTSKNAGSPKFVQLPKNSICIYTFQGNWRLNQPVLSQLFPIKNNFAINEIPPKYGFSRNNINFKLKPTYNGMWLFETHLCYVRKSYLHICGFLSGKW